jgi:hypothetical protein
VQIEVVVLQGKKSGKLEKQAEQGGDGRQCDAAADDYGDEGMKAISAEQSRANIIASDEKHREGVDALSSAIDRAKKTDAKAESVSEPKPLLASLLLA